MKVDKTYILSDDDIKLQKLAIEVILAVESRLMADRAAKTTK